MQLTITLYSCAKKYGGNKNRQCGVTKIGRFIQADKLEEDVIKEMTLELGLEEWVGFRPKAVEWLGGWVVRGLFQTEEKVVKEINCQKGECVWGIGHILVWLKRKI